MRRHMSRGNFTGIGCSGSLKIRRERMHERVTSTFTLTLIDAAHRGMILGKCKIISIAALKDHATTRSHRFCPEQRGLRLSLQERKDRLTRKQSRASARSKVTSGIASWIKHWPSHQAVRLSVL